MELLPLKVYPFTLAIRQRKLTNDKISKNIWYTIILVICMHAGCAIIRDLSHGALVITSIFINIIIISLSSLA